MCAEFAESDSAGYGLQREWEYGGDAVSGVCGYYVAQCEGVGGGKISLTGYSKEHRVGVNLDGVMVTDDASYKYAVAHADIKVGPGPVNLKLEGEDSTVTGSAGKGSLESCASKLVPFPR